MPRSRPSLSVWSSLLALGVLLGPVASAHAADLLFVSDRATDTNIAAALMADGHDVTVVTGDFASGANPTLTGSLGAYDAVFWSATGGGFGSTHDAATFTALDAYVASGGYVFVTGYDSIASPTDPNLIAFLGGSGSRDVPSAPGPIVMAANALTTGIVDIQGVTPTGASGDRDALTGLGADTVNVCASSSVAGEAQWSLRTPAGGGGLIAYVSNGNAGSSSTHPSWTNTASGGAGAYNAALRNFAFWASRGNFLFVSDASSDTNVPAALTADGHTVTTVTGDFSGGANPTLTGDLSAYDAVFWSATGNGFGANHDAATFTALDAYVSAGGRVFVTGYDSIASPTDANLIAFLGGSGSRDVPGAPGAVIMAANELNTGVVDIRGVTPTGAAGDRDALTGLGADTTNVCASGTVAGEAQWSLRTLGMGLAAYVSNGNPGTSAHPSWTNTAAGGDGAYNAALRNFAKWAAVAGFGSSGLPDGDMCMADTDCGSGFCVDGVCCDSACGAGATDDCQACAIAAGAAADGVCGAVSAGTECRASAGVCDAAETCDGAALTCPADAFAAAGTSCRAAAGACDAEETCDGASAACPADGFIAAGTECRAAAGLCDAAETCDGATAACPADGFVAAGTECRAAADLCDAAEACDGSSAACPADGLVAAGTVCRMPTDLCDAAEACDGSSAACPMDTVVAAGTTCRPAADVCDAEEACDGASVACPADGALAAGTVCRMAADVCDADEACDGTSIACPADAFAAAGTECRASTGSCDPAESCDGASAGCPMDALAADGEACDDGMSCVEGEVCAAGACTGGEATDCDDGDVCTADMCAEPDGCSNEPIAGCCVADVDCDDGDECTTDSCGGDNTCANDPIPGCGATDAGTDDDGGTTDGDGGVGGGDGGTTPPTTGDGCSCAVPGSRSASVGETPALLGLLLLGFVLLGRRRRR
ncbi:MAG: hypothetical protein VYE22_23605 [Myxococcota bacterium]|nr:hypothetical protein [Myxococcota bacterium]